MSVDLGGRIFVLGEQKIFVEDISRKFCNNCQDDDPNQVFEEVWYVVDLVTPSRRTVPHYAHRHFCQNGLCKRAWMTTRFPRVTEITKAEYDTAYNDEFSRG